MGQFDFSQNPVHVAQFPLSVLDCQSLLYSIWEKDDQVKLLHFSEGIWLFFNQHRCKRTVSMETGCQNIQLCSTILNVTFPPEVIGPLFFFPLLYMIFQIGEGLLLIAIFRCYKKFKTPRGKY